jgi:D-glycero-D-manno-heptose 1,7-bisphosphate phosphatase
MARFLHAIVDRDGVLNREPAKGWVTHPSAWVWEAGARDALRLLAEAGVETSVVTNQSCVGRGLASAVEIDTVNRLLVDEAAKAGGRIARVLVCPHVDEDACDCRKPAPGLVDRAIDESGIAAAQSVAIGDAPRDLEAGRAAGVAVALVRTGKGAATEAALDDGELLVFDDLYQAAGWIVNDAL